MNFTTQALALTTLSFLVALSWNDAVRSIYERITGDRQTVMTRVIFSVIVTAVALWIFVTFDIKSKQQIDMERDEKHEQNKS